MKIFQKLVLFLIALVVIGTTASESRAQSNLVLFGDVKIDESKVQGEAPARVMIVLIKNSGTGSLGELGRQPISNGSRYRFDHLTLGDYEIAIEVDNNEIGRIRTTLQGMSNDPHGYRQDLDFALKPRGTSVSRGAVLSAADMYNRPAANKSLFDKAQDAVAKKKYDQATTLLSQVVGNDKQDFQAWTLLGTVYVMQEKPADGEKAYLSALEAKPTFALALIDLGRLRSSQKKYEEAIDPLTRAVEAQPQSGEANLLLGEAYLQLKKGSKAIPYLNAAATNGKPDAHLRLGWLYNAAGMKDKAVIEYEQFIQKQPNYADRKKLEDYISANKKH